MRKLTAGLFHAIDGVVEAPNLFQFDSFDDELGAMLGAVMADVDSVVMGRVGYSEWAGYWPTATQDGEFAEFINGVPKHVASRSLKPADLTWSNSTLIEGDLHDFIRTLKAKSGGTIAVMGGISLVRELFLAGLLDELTLITHPVISGKGKHLFQPDDPTTRLELVRADITSKGNIVSVYRLKA